MVVPSAVTGLRRKVALPWSGTRGVEDFIDAVEVGNAVAAKTRSLTREWNAIEPLLSQLAQPTQPVTTTTTAATPTGDVSDRLSWSKVWWAWADAVFWSRVFSLHEAAAAQYPSSHTRTPVIPGPSHLNDLCLVPFLDLINHSARACNARWDLVTSRSSGAGADTEPDGPPVPCIALVVDATKLVPREDGR